MSTANRFSAGLVNLFNIFGYFGLAPYKLTPDGHCRKDTKRLTCSMLALALIPGPYFYLSIKYEERYESIDSYIINSFKFLSFVTSTACGFSIAINAITQRDTMINMLNDLVKLDTEFRLNRKQVAVAAMVFGCAMVYRFVAYFHRYGYKMYWDVSIYSTTFGINALKLGFLWQYALLHHAFKENFRAIRLKLEENHGVVTVSKSMPPVLNAARNRHHKLWKLSQAMCRLFSTIIISEIFSGILGTIIFSYSLIKITAVGYASGLSVFLDVSGLVVELFPILAIVYACASTKNEALKIPEALHKFEAKFEDSKVANFSLQLIHERIQFTACGLFEIDGKLLHSIFAVICSYLVIILQFELALHPVQSLK